MSAGIFDTEHRMVRDSARAFVAREVAPHVDAWEAAGEFPRDLYRKAGAAGLLAVIIGVIVFP